MGNNVAGIPSNFGSTFSPPSGSTGMGQYMGQPPPQGAPPQMSQSGDINTQLRPNTMPAFQGYVPFDVNNFDLQAALNRAPEVGIPKGAPPQYPAGGINGIPAGGMAAAGPYVPGNQRNPSYQDQIAIQAAKHAEMPIAPTQAEIGQQARADQQARIDAINASTQAKRDAWRSRGGPRPVSTRPNGAFNAQEKLRLQEKIAAAQNLPQYTEDGQLIRGGQYLQQPGAAGIYGQDAVDQQRLMAQALRG